MFSNWAAVHVDQILTGGKTVDITGGYENEDDL